MSYGAQICFKTIKADQLFTFFKEIKTECTAKFKEIAKDCFIYLPTLSSHYKNLDEFTQEGINRSWMKEKIFTFRYFYLPEYELLGMFSIPRETEKLFDTTIYFQNSTDQNYDWEVWNGIEEFEISANKWQLIDKEIIYKKYLSRDFATEVPIEDFDDDYYRKTFCYEEIWDKIRRFLDDEKEIVYLSLYGGYETFEAMKFVKYCEDFYNDWRQSLNETASAEGAKV